MIGPERSPRANEDVWFRFHHILIRDAAYQGLLKRRRAALHERFADSVEAVSGERDRGVEYEEIVGYHLEQAHRYLSELGHLDDHGRDLAVRSGRPARFRRPPRLRARRTCPRPPTCCGAR